MLGPELGEDAAQEATVEAWLRLAQLRRADAFGPWLAGIGLNVCRRWLRFRSREAWSLDTLLGGRRIAEPVDLDAGTETLAELGDLARQVHVAVAGLPRGQRAAVVLFYLAGLTLAETAATLGIKVGSLKSRLHKARRSLRRELWTLWSEEHGMEALEDRDLVAVRVADIRRITLAEPGLLPRNVVLLQEVGRDERVLPIWIGRFESDAMAILLERIEVSRPLTFKFMASILQAASARLKSVRITRLEGETYFAEAAIESEAGTRSVDARPSDAMTLALMCEAPIYVARSLLDTSAVARESFDRPRPGQTEVTGLDEIAAELRQTLSQEYSYKRQRE
jgi:RNA polymerase sigma factor (sigma-70 family)